VTSFAQQQHNHTHFYSRMFSAPRRAPTFPQSTVTSYCSECRRWILYHYGCMEGWIRIWGRKKPLKLKDHDFTSSTCVWQTFGTQLWHLLYTGWHTAGYGCKRNDTCLSPRVFAGTCVCVCVCACGGSQLSPVHWVHMEKNSRSDERSTWGLCLCYWVWPGVYVYQFCNY